MDDFICVHLEINGLSVVSVEIWGYDIPFRQIVTVSDIPPISQHRMHANRLQPLMQDLTAAHAGPISTSHNVNEFNHSTGLQSGEALIKASLFRHADR